jgi:hypothetical protein
MGYTQIDNDKINADQWAGRLITKNTKIPFFNPYQFKVETMLDLYNNEQSFQIPYNFNLTINYPPEFNYFMEVNLKYT